MTLIFIADDIPTKITMLPPLSLLLHARGKLFQRVELVFLLFIYFFLSFSAVPHLVNNISGGRYGG